MRKTVAGDRAGARHGQRAGITIQYPCQIGIDLAGGGHILHIGGNGHGISGMELGSIKFRIAGMLSEIGRCTQELPVVAHQIPVPGGVAVVVLTLQVDDVPGVAFGAGNIRGDTTDIAAVHIQLQQQPVVQAGIALADRILCDQCRVGGMLVVVGVVFQVVPVEVILHIFRDPVIGTLDFLVIGCIPKVQLIQQRFHRCIHFRFHGCIADEAAVHSDNAVDTVGIFAGGDRGGVSNHIGPDIVTLIGHTGVVSGLQEQIGHIGGSQRNAVQTQFNMLLPLNHSLPQLFNQSIGTCEGCQRLRSTADGAGVVFVGMSGRIHIIIHIAVTTGAGVGGVTLFGTGRRSNAGFIGVLAYNRNTDVCRNTVRCSRRDNCGSGGNSGDFSAGIHRSHRGIGGTPGKGHRTGSASGTQHSLQSSAFAGLHGNSGCVENDRFLLAGFAVAGQFRRQICNDLFCSCLIRMNIIQQKARLGEGCNTAQIHIYRNPSVCFRALVDGIHKHPVVICGIFRHLQCGRRFGRP